MIIRGNIIYYFYIFFSFKILSTGDFGVVKNKASIVKTGCKYMQYDICFHCYPRYMLGIAGVPSVIQFFGFFFLPESPRWLVGQGRVDEARKALKKIRGLDNVDREMSEIEKSVEETKEQNKYSEWEYSKTS